VAQEATKFRERWKRDGIFDRYFKDKTILDIGCGSDKILPSAHGWELDPDGNGQLLTGLADASFDVVFSSHFLEHTADPLESLLNQWRVLRPSGYLIFQIPDEDLYEQFLYPSPFNTDHKYTWTIHKDISWSPASKNIIDLIRYLPNHKIISLRVIDTGYDYSRLLSDIAHDQTDLEKAEACIEGIIQKSPPSQCCHSLLDRCFLCSRCGRMEFVIRGKNREGRLEGYCRGCGDTTTQFTGFIYEPTDVAGPEAPGTQPSDTA
jgi:hypothetical protein